MPKTPWFRFFPSDWLAGVSGLSACEAGVYINLIALMYDNGGSVSATDRRWLAKVCGISGHRFGPALDTLVRLGKVVIDGDRLTNNRVQDEFLVSKNRFAKAQLSAQQRWQKTQQNQPDDDALASKTHSPSNANQNQNIKTGTNVPAKKNGHHPLRSDWALGPDLIAYAERYGFTPGEAEDIAEDMRNWATANGREKKSWYATYQTFVRSEAKRRKENGHQPSYFDVARIAEEFAERSQ